MDPLPVKDSRPSSRAAAIIVSALVALIAVVIVVIATSGSLHAMLGSIAHGNVHRLRLQLRGLGGLAVLALVALVLAHTFLPFPAEILAAAGGFALGAPVALPVLLFSFLVSALIAYSVGALAGRPAAARLAGQQRLETLERIVERGGARALLAVRLFPLMPFSPLCLACGVAAVPLWRYTWTSVVGMLPELALVTFLGTRLTSSPTSDPLFWTLSACLILLVLLGSRLVRSFRSGDSATSPGDAMRRETC